MRHTLLALTALVLAPLTRIPAAEQSVTGVGYK